MGRPGARAAAPRCAAARAGQVRSRRRSRRAAARSHRRSPRSPVPYARAAAIGLIAVQVGAPAIVVPAAAARIGHAVIDDLPVDPVVVRYTAGVIPEIAVAGVGQVSPAQGPGVKIGAWHIDPARLVPLVIAPVVEPVLDAVGEHDLRRQRGPAGDVVTVAPRDPPRSPRRVGQPHPADRGIERPAAEVEHRPAERLVAAPGQPVGAALPVSNGIRAPVAPDIRCPDAAIAAIEPAAIMRQRLEEYGDRIDRLAVRVIARLDVAGRVLRGRRDCHSSGDPDRRQQQPRPQRPSDIHPIDLCAVASPRRVSGK